MSDSDDGRAPATPPLLPSPMLEALYQAREKRKREDDAELCEKSLSHFIKQSWHVLKPMEPYIHNWHIEAVCEKLEAVSAGEIKRLQVWVPPGTMKPVSVDALVLTSTGERRRLGDIEVGDRVVTHTGASRRVEAVHEQGLLPTLRIETDCGRVTHAALDHPFLTPEGWVRADELRIGMVLGSVSRPMLINAQGVDPCEARLAGYFIGDGNVTYGQRQRSLAANITCFDDELGRDIIHCAEELGFEAEYSKAKNTRRLNLRKGVRSWLERRGLAGHTSHTKRVPDFIMKADHDAVAEFVGAYFACDGTLTKRGNRRDLTIIFNSVNRDLLGDIQHLLLRLGVQGRIRPHRGDGFMGPDYLSWKLAITSFDQTAKFLERVPVLGDKARRLKEWSPERSRFEEPILPDRIVSIEDGGLRECRCLTVAVDHSFTSDDLIVKNTMTVSVFWPSWEWIKNPWLRYWGASYEVRMAGRIAAMSRDLMMDPWYQERWGDKFNFSREGENYFGNDMGGTRLATAPQSTGTGEHGHRILIDDPIRAASADATSKVTLTEVNNWYDGTVVTRGIGPNHARVIIMQRLHEEDLAAHVLEAEDWEVLCLPERYEPDHPFVWPDDPRTEEGELIWPEQRDDAASTALANSLTPHRAAGQLQQRPSAKEGDILQTKWWRFYDNRIKEKEEWSQLPAFSMVVMSLDCPLKDKETNDNIALQTWGIHGMHRYLVDIRLGKMSYPVAKRATIEMAEWARKTWPRARHVMLIENTGYGSDLILDLKSRFTGLTKISPQQDGDKVVRADRASDALSSGHCFLPGYGPPWQPPVYDAGSTPADINEFINNCSRFPNATHDDDVDAWSQMINWMRGKQTQPVRTSSASARRRAAATR